MVRKCTSIYFGGKKRFTCPAYPCILMYYCSLIFISFLCDCAKSGSVIVMLHFVERLVFVNVSVNNSSITVFDFLISQVIF